MRRDLFSYPNTFLFELYNDFVEVGKSARGLRELMSTIENEQTVTFRHARMRVFPNAEAYVFSNFYSNFLLTFGKLCEARSRLYRS